MTANLQILIVDDEPEIRRSLGDFLGKLGHEVEACGSVDEARARLVDQRFDVVLLDILLPGTHGLDYLEELRAKYPGSAVVMISGHGTMDHAITALRLGASDFLKKPIRLMDLEETLIRCELLMRCEKMEDLSPVHEDHSLVVDMLGESSATQAVRSMVRMAAESGAENILIHGETGTGKEIAAQLFHHHRHGRNTPFIAVNCPALPEALAESELFGHERGAFTGAGESRCGAFELADGGVLFLDEVADLSPAIQAKLLRVLETRKVRRVGGSRDIAVNVSVVAACNRPLELLVSGGQFRPDLYYRLDGFSIELLPLRERPDDILSLAQFFLKQYAERVHRQSAHLSKESEAALLSYTYPGNVRELRNMMERASIMAGQGEICTEYIRFARPMVPRTEQGDLTLVAAIAQREAEETLSALRVAGWNKSKAARRLGVSYETIRWRIKKYNLIPAQP